MFSNEAFCIIKISKKNCVFVFLTTWPKKFLNKHMINQNILNLLRHMKELLKIFIFSNYQKNCVITSKITYNVNWIRLGWPRRSGSPSEVRRFHTDGSFFGRKSDPIAEAKAKFFENPIRFNFPFFRRIGSDSFLFFVGLEEKNCFRSDPMATLNQTFYYLFYEALQLIISFSKPFHIITIDFIVILLKFKKIKFNYVISIIDKFSKAVTFITNYIAKSNKWWTIELFNHFTLINWKLFHAIISDQNFHFIKQIWRRILEHWRSLLITALSIIRKLTTCLNASIKQQK